jgi:hypothetical protein
VSCDIRNSSLHLFSLSEMYCIQILTSNVRARGSIQYGLTVNDFVDFLLIFLKSSMYTYIPFAASFSSDSLSNASLPST